MYDSEDRLEAAYGRLGKRLDTVSEMQAWVDEIVRSRWFGNRWPYLTYVQVRDGRGRKNATGYALGSYWSGDRIPQTEGVLKMPRWSRNKMTILHELAHVVTDCEYNGKASAHGAEYCSLYLKLVRRWMSKGWHSALKGAFKIEKVKYRMVNV